MKKLKKNSKIVKNIESSNHKYSLPFLEKKKFSRQQNRFYCYLNKTEIEKYEKFKTNVSHYVKTRVVMETCRFL